MAIFRRVRFESCDVTLTVSLTTWEQGGVLELAQNCSVWRHILWYIWDYCRSVLSAFCFFKLKTKNVPYWKLIIQNIKIYPIWANSDIVAWHQVGAKDSDQKNWFVPEALLYESGPNFSRSNISVGMRLTVGLTLWDVWLNTICFPGGRSDVIIVVF